MLTPTFTFGTICSGVGGLDLALMRAGGMPIFQCEKDPRARAVLRLHFPNVLLIHDVYDAHRIPTVAILAFGSPCQNLSMAGDRTGLAGTQSRVFFECWRVVRESGPRVVIFENVFGLLSSGEGRDFAVVIGAFTGCLPEVPAAGWGNAGFMRAARPDCYGVAWRVLDAQHFGVPQRRRRVVLVATLGDGGCAEILFEPSSMSWDTKPRGEAEGEATIAIKDSPSGGSSGAGETEIVAAMSFQSRIARNGRGQPTAVVPSLTSEAGTCGTGDSAPMVAIAFDQTQVTCPTNRSQPAAGRECHTLAAQATALVAIGFNSRQDPTPTANLITGLDGADQCTPNVCIPIQDVTAREKRQNGSGIAAPGAPAYTLDTHGLQGVAIEGVRWMVRRLTPREYERLQAHPDDWTATGLDDDRKPVELKDGARYAAMGNGVAACVFEWVGRRAALYLQGLPINPPTR